jgi:hypothetical protein
MASSIINSDDGVVSGTSGLKTTGGDDGVLVFQSKGTETARINTDKQIVAAAGTASLPALTTTGDLNTGVFFPAADTIAFAEGGAEAMRIDSSGNVGIGTSSPGNTLDVANSGTGQLRLTRTGLTYWDLDVGSSSSLIIKRDSVDRMRIDSDGNLLFNSGYGSVATAYGCRAWVNFDGTGTPAIRDDGNVSSITDNGTGVYTVNLTTAMPDTNYAWVGTCEAASNTGGIIVCKRYDTALTTSAVRLQTLNVGNAAVDPREVYFAIFR